MSKLQVQVAEFMREFDQKINFTPTVPSDGVVALRARLIAEEFFEVLHALYGDRGEFHMAKSLIGNVLDSPTAGSKVDLLLLADGLADLDYVVEGSRLAFGIDGDPVADLVHAANMAKVGGQRREDGKWLKPRQWQAPDIAGELARQGETRTSNMTNIIRRFCAREMTQEEQIVGWPRVLENDDGIRPAGRPDECFYCRRKIGSLHAFECVCVTKLIAFRVTAKLEDGTERTGTWTFDEPFFWDKHVSEFHKNGSTWCISNMLDYPVEQFVWDQPDAREQIEKMEGPDRCLCNGRIEFKFIRVVDATPRRSSD